MTKEPDNYSRKLTLVIRKETYFEKVVTDYPKPNRPLQIEQDFQELQNVFVKLEDSNALFNLGNALFILERFDEALEASEKAIQLDPSFTEVLHQK